MPDQRQSILHALIDLFAYKAAYQTETCGLRLQDMQLLERLGSGEPVQTLELARRCGLAPATAVAILDRLQEAGLVRRRRDRSDKRVVKVGLTAAGRELLLRHTGEDQAFADNLFASLPPDESVELERLLAKALANVSEDTIFEQRKTCGERATRQEQ